MILGTVKTKKVILPSSTPDDQNWVELNVASTAKDMMSVDKENKTQEEIGIAIITTLIKSWSFTNTDGTPAEITPGNVELLPSIDFIAINNALGFTNESTDTKKNS